MSITTKTIRDAIEDAQKFGIGGLLSINSMGVLISTAEAFIARLEADEADRAERERVMRDCFATAVSGGGGKPYVKIVCQSIDHLHETYRLVIGIKPAN